MYIFTTFTSEIRGDLVVSKPLARCGEVGSIPTSHTLSLFFGTHNCATWSPTVGATCQKGAHRCVPRVMWGPTDGGGGCWWCYLIKENKS